MGGFVAILGRRLVVDGAIYLKRDGVSLRACYWLLKCMWSSCSLCHVFFEGLEKRGKVERRIMMVMIMMLMMIMIVSIICFSLILIHSFIHSFDVAQRRYK